MKVKATPAPDDSWLPGKKKRKEPSPDGADLLNAAEGLIRRYVVLPPSAYLPLALWSIATHTVMAFDCFPYICALSPMKRSGKTRLMEVLETIVREPWRATAPSPAALYRMLGTAPTMMLDEVEIFNGKNKSETTMILLAVLNAGHRKGGFIPRCEGPRQEVRQFPVYGPKVFAAIGKLPDTLMDRSIVLHMKRRSKGQQVERFRQTRAFEAAEPVREGASQFVQANDAEIASAYQSVLDSDLDFLSDRDSEIWSALFTLCKVLDSERLHELKQSALTLSAAKDGDDVDESFALTLLRDIKSVWPGGWDKGGEDKCETAFLISKLKELEESPWGEIEHPLTARKLARMLRPFDVEPRSVRIGDRTPKGYFYKHLKPVLDLYLGEKSATCATEQQ